MEIYKIPACWPTSFFHGIPLSDMLNKENFYDKKYNTFYLSKNTLNPILIDFIFQFSSIANLSKETPEAALILFDFYLSREKEFKHDIQLIAMTCILICSKMFDVNPLSLNTLHRISTHVYNNAMVLNCETYLLRLINFDVFVRDNLLTDRVGLYLENVRCFFEKEDFNVFVDLCFKISALIHEEMKLRKCIGFNLLCVSIIQAALVIATKRDGVLPLTIKLCIISGVNQEDVMKVSKKIIKHSIGKEIYKQYNF